MGSLKRVPVANLIASITPDTPVNDIWNNLKDILPTAQATHVPTKITSLRFQLPWFNRTCKKAVRKKKRSYRKMAIQCEKLANKTCEKVKNDYIKSSIINDDGKKTQKTLQVHQVKKK